MTPNTNQSLDFASGYSRSHRLYECGGILLGITCSSALAVRLASADNVSGWWAPLTLLVGLLGADLASGLIHWACDTWGNVETPIVGQLAIRSFREHHVDAKSITRHDFVETNGHNIALSILPSVIGLVALTVLKESLLATLVGMTMLSLGTFVGLTSQIHKWAHMDEPPKVVRWLQDARLFISPSHHDVHHSAPNDSAYCITVGWLNGPLQAIGFFRKMERVISAVTGWTPRQGD